jgi:putative nucleotidyltransferase with HDIG domain
MLNRIKQFFSAVTAKITGPDREFVDKSLYGDEKALFFGMNVPDQRHALNVAYTALDLAQKGESVDRRLLVRCALLHDVGKVRGDVSTFDKVITVLAQHFAPDWAKKWGRYGRGGRLDNLRHAFYTYYHHAERGAQLLTAVGSEPQLISIILRHHELPAAIEASELKLLRQADSLN